MTTRKILGNFDREFQIMHGKGADRYTIIRRNIVLWLLVITLCPLAIMAAINYYEFERSWKSEIIGPLRAVVEKATHSCQLAFEEHLSTVRFIASAYPYEELKDQQVLNRLFPVLKEEFGSFVDLGLIDESGIKVSYAGPYSLVGKDYSEHDWFNEVKIKDVFISDVFLGYRNFPHISIAVHHYKHSESHTGWILRATFETNRLKNIIASMGLDPESDAFLINDEGIFQTQSRFYGNVLEKCPFEVPPGIYNTHVVETVDPKGRKVLVIFAPLKNPDYLLVTVRPQNVVMGPWFVLKGELFLVFLVSVIIIFMFIIWLSNFLVNSLKDADERRDHAVQNLEQNQRLSSIGRMAAGVAHEINNPLGIINEKAGLMKDLLEIEDGFEKKEKFMEITDSILKSIVRCRTITHRLLGFARKMEVKYENIDINNVIREVRGFIEKEIMYQNIDLILQLDENLPEIYSDHGQLQQVFLNILTNAVTAVEKGGRITITSWVVDEENIGVSFQDNGVGMSEETIKQIFDPFFTTKKAGGTGLGLSITYGIVRKLGGEIQVKSEEEEGSTFIVYLPINTEKKE